jgi:hypothetical protein
MRRMRRIEEIKEIKEIKKMREIKGILERAEMLQGLLIDATTLARQSSTMIHVGRDDKRWV